MLEHDVERQSAARADLAAWRRTGASGAFTARAATLGDNVGLETSAARAAIEALELEVLQRSTLVPSVVVRASPSQARRLAQLPGVLDVQPAGQRNPALAEATAAHGLPEVHGAALGGLSVEGGGVTIAILDSGLDLHMAGTNRPHAAFYPEGSPASSGPGIDGSRILSTEWYGVQGVCASLPTPGEDEVGHGTRIAAIAAGADWNDQASIADGAAPSANLRNYKISDCGSSLASTFAMGQALEAAVLQPDVRVVNLSYDGTADPGFDFNRKLDAAVEAGVTVVVSAGNFGAAQDFMHGSFDTIAVGSSFVSSKQPYEFPGFQQSAVGPLPDGRSYPQMLAVGEQIATAALNDEAGSIDSYGTSGAAALVSGTAALLYQVAPTLDPLEVKAVLLASASDLDGGDPNAGGFGFLDAPAALAMVEEGRYSSGAVAAGEEARYGFFAAAGDPLAFTLVTGRASSTVAVDMDLILLGPGGSPISATSAARDNVEQIVDVAPATGLYTLIVRPQATFGSAPRSFAIAGLGGTPAVLQDPTVVPQSLQVAGTFDVTSGSFYVKGLGLADVDSVTVAGQAASFSFEAPARIRVESSGDLLGANLPVVLGGVNGTDTAFVSLAAAAPELVTWTPNFESTLKWMLFGEPHAAYWTVISVAPTPTSLPGIADLAIGAGGQSLFLVDSGLTDGEGFADQILSGLGSLPDGLTVYLQAIQYDFDVPGFDASTVATALHFTHFLPY